MNSKITLSICMITYNHESFIEEAINSILTQQTDFDFELVISNDKSTDKTDEIVQQIISNHPKANLIKYFNQKQNLGMYDNFMFALNQCKGKYIALCDADDYWTDNTKLQKQVDLLEQYPELSFCFHKAYRFDILDETRNKIYPENTPNEIIDAEMFFNIPTIPTASLVYRNQIQFPKLVHSHADMLLYAALLSIGKAGFIMEKMSAYRLHPKGVSSTYNQNWYLERRISELKIEKNYKGFSKNVRVQISKIYVDHILVYLNINVGKLKFKDKSNFIKELLSSSSFYKKNLKEYIRVLKIVLQ